MENQQETEIFWKGPEIYWKYTILISEMYVWKCNIFRT